MFCVWKTSRSQYSFQTIILGLHPDLDNFEDFFLIFFSRLKLETPDGLRCVSETKKRLILFIGAVGASSMSAIEKCH